MMEDDRNSSDMVRRARCSRGCAEPAIFDFTMLHMTATTREVTVMDDVGILMISHRLPTVVRRSLIGC